MKHLDLIIKIMGGIVVVLIFWGIFAPQVMPILTPAILAGTVAVMALYAINAFKTKNYAKIGTILILGIFIAAIALYGLFA